MRYPSRVLPADAAPDRISHDKPGARFVSAEQLASIPPSTEEQRRRLGEIVEDTAVAESWPEGPGMVLEMLGLVAAAVDEMHSVACPTCGAAVGALCVGNHNTMLNEVHAARRRLVEPPEPAYRVQGRTVECPLCGAKPEARCVSKNGNLIPNIHSVRVRAAKEHVDE